MARQGDIYGHEKVARESGKDTGTIFGLRFAARPRKSQTGNDAGWTSPIVRRRMQFAASKDQTSRDMAAF